MCHLMHIGLNNFLDIKILYTYVVRNLCHQMSDLTLPDNTISSVAKGCFSKNVVHAKPLPALRREPHGAMGILNMPQ